ncbi:hypothetical protein Tco_0083812 [Tanacetum coccineum]
MPPSSSSPPRRHHPSHHRHHGCTTAVIIEQRVKVNQKAAFWSLNEEIMKSTVLTTNMPYPSRKIRRIRALDFTQQEEKINTSYPEEIHMPYWIASHGIFWNIIIVELTPKNPNTPY